MTMRILVTGATGFVGSRLALRAAAQGHQVIASGRRLNDKLAAQFKAAAIDVQLGDVTDAAFVNKVMADVTHVCHLAAAWQEVGVPDEYFRTVTVGGAKNVAHAAIEHGVKMLVHCSTSGVHSRRSGSVISETSPFEITNAYEAAKAEAEEALVQIARSRGLPTIMLRPADGYGPGDLRLLKLYRAVAKGRFPLFGPGAGRRHMIYVDDLADAFLAACAAQTSTPEAVLIAGPEVVTLRELLERLARVLGSARYGIRLPLAPMRLLTALTEDGCRLAGIKHPPLYRRRLDFYSVDVEYDIRKARSLLSWEPRTSLDAGFRQAAQWYRAEGLL
jgi:nucleoside-diphosphate-sugar epimerase